MSLLKYQFAVRGRQHGTCGDCGQEAVTYDVAGVGAIPKGWRCEACVLQQGRFLGMTDEDLADWRLMLGAVTAGVQNQREYETWARLMEKG